MFVVSNRFNDLRRRIFFYVSYDAFKARLTTASEYPVRTLIQLSPGANTCTSTPILFRLGIKDLRMEVKLKNKGLSHNRPSHSNE